MEATEGLQRKKLFYFVKSIWTSSPQMTIYNSFNKVDGAGSVVNTGTVVSCLVRVVCPAMHFSLLLSLSRSEALTITFRT